MTPGMTENQIRDYKSALKSHLNPFFGNVPFSEFKPVLIEKFIAQLKDTKNRYGKPLAAKTVRNYMIPLHTIVRDAMDEVGWDDMRDPFWGTKLPKVTRTRVQPFNYEEWLLVLEHMLAWYRPYFEFAIQTGLEALRVGGSQMVGLGRQVVYPH